MEKQVETAIEIISLFEDLLEANNLTIPDRDREGNEEEARIYGMNYYRLEDEITGILKKFKRKK